MNRNAISRPHVGRKRRRDRTRTEHEHFEAVDILAAEHVGDPSEQGGADRSGHECGRADDRNLQRIELPLAGDEFECHTDDEQIVRIGEETHPRNEHDAPLLALILASSISLNRLMLLLMRHGYSR